MAIVKKLLVGMAGAMFGLLGTTGAAQAVTIFSGAGADAASAFQAMQAAIGGVNNGAAEPQADGFRTINWDGVRLDGTDFGGNTEVIIQDRLVLIPEDRFLDRGTLYDEEYPVSGDGFESANPGVAGQFPAFSPNNTFAHFGEDDNEIEQSFTVPGTTTPASTRGFGAIFLDVELPDTSFIEFFSGSNSLGRFFVEPASSGQPSFLGVLFDDPIVTDVELNLGNAQLFDLENNTIVPGPADDPQNGVDLVAVDDFLYAEPVEVESAEVRVPESSFTLAVLAVGALGIGSLIKYHQKRA
jgi:hypothetical protein